jgi:hypothetical protein
VSFRDEHELAGLRRRSDDELPDADAGADGAELRVGRRRHRDAVALIRGFRAATAEPIGNFWVDMGGARSTSCCRSRSRWRWFLVSQGAVQNFDAVSDRPAAAGDGGHGRPARHEQMLRWGRRRRRSPSSSSGRTAAGSST